MTFHLKLSTELSLLNVRKHPSFSEPVQPSIDGARQNARAYIHTGCAPTIGTDKTRERSDSKVGMKF
jgi:hypothetical protein